MKGFSETVIGGRHNRNMTVLAMLENRILDDLSEATQAELDGCVDLAREAQTAIAGYLLRVACRATDLAAAGIGTSPEETMRRGGASAKQANREARRAKTSKEMPKVGKALEEGRANSENVDLVNFISGRITDPDHLVALLKLDAEVATNVVTMAPEVFARWYRKKVQAIQADNGLSRFEQQRSNSRFPMRWGAGGMLLTPGEFDPEWGELVQNAVRARARQIAKALGVPLSDHIQAQAVAEICEAWLAGNEPGSVSGSRGAKRSNGSRPSISVLVDQRTMTEGPHAGTVSETQSGQSIPPQTIGRLACDAAITAIEINGDGQRLRVGHEKRTATYAQRKALRALYRTCAIDGVTTFDLCEVHHVCFYRTREGPTDIENLLPISKYWHHKLHEGGWKLEIGADRSLLLTSPDGKHQRTIPPPMPLSSSEAA